MFTCTHTNGVNDEVPISVEVKRILVLNGTCMPKSAEYTDVFKTAPAVLSFLIVMSMFPLFVIFVTAPIEYVHLYKRPATGVKAVALINDCTAVEELFKVAAVSYFLDMTPKGKLFAWALVNTCPVVKVVFGDAISTPVC